MNATEMQTWLEESDPETSAFEISRESFTELVKYMQSLTAQLTSAKELIATLQSHFQDECGDCSLVTQLSEAHCELTSAKEEGAALIESQMQRAEAAEAALSAERKETERLRYELNQFFGMACDAPELNMSNYYVDQVAALNAAMVEIWKAAKAALQERQGEEQVCEWDGNVAGCGGWQQYKFCPYCRKPLVIKEEVQ